MKDRPRKSPLNRKLVALAVAACFVTEWAYANPTAPTVVHGAAAFQQAGNLLQITNSPNAIINWGSFSIGASEITRFIQQSQASAVLNRVIGQDPSSILGALQSNGRVFLINPNGILFGAGAQIDVAGLVASTLNLSNADFLAGRLKFTEVPGAGSIVNQGNITTGQGGQVYLVGPAVTNSGIITSPGGEVILAAGNSVELVNPGTPDLRVEITAPDNEARNLGQIVADSGRVGIYAGLIKHSGTIRADSAQVTEDGRIVLKATKEVTLEAGSVTTANGPTGGRIEIHSGDTTLVAGTVEVKGTPSPLMGEGEGGGGTGKGGTIHILGNKVGVIDAARLDASGATGGGTVLIGGDYQGRNPEIQNAYRTYFGPSARVAADAVTAGDGGKVIVWSDDATRAYGTITARGGAQSGNGGFVEVSGKNWLDFNASVDVRAPNGVTGALLLDPNSVEIGNTDSFGGGSFDDLIPNVFSSSSDGLSQIAWSTVKSNLAASAVYITTLGDTTSGNADITVSANSPDLDTTNTLRLLSNRHVTVNGSITNTKAGALEMFAGWDGASTTAPAVSSFGNITLNSGISVSGDVSLIANNDITQGVSGIISANKLLVSSNSGSVLLNTATSMVNTLAGRANDQFLFKNGQSLTIDTVGATSGITVNNTSSGNSTVDVQITSGSLAVNKNISATGGNAFSGGAATVTLTSPNGITVNNLSAVSATGGNGSGSGNGGDATLQANAGGTIDLTGSTLTATGGVGGGFGNPGTGTVKLEVSTASGNGTPSGDIIAHNITADNINLQQQSDAGNRSILRASASSLIQAGDLLMEIDYPGSTSGGSIGTSAEPMRVQVARLEAHTHEASPGIFIESPNAGNLQIGGVSFFTGSVKGVQNVTSGDISLSVNGTLTLQAGTAGCGATGGTGGPICTGGSTVTLTANDMSLGNSVNANTGTVMLAPFATSRNINIEGPTPTVGTLSLNTGELQQITAGTLQIGRSTDTGTLTVATAVGSGDVTASTLKLAHQNIAINGALNVGTNTLVLTATGTVEQTAPITAGTLELLGAGGEHALTDPANQIGTVKANTGSVTLVNDGALVVSGISTGGVGAETIVAASPLVAGEQFGGSIAVKGDVMIVGAPGTFQTGIGAVYVYRWNGTAWVFEAKLVPPDSIARNFGTGVAVEGTHAVVGAPETTDVNFRSGAAYAFEFDGSSWGSGTKLAFSQKVFESVFGVSAAIDNNRLVIGGNGRTSEGGFWTGKIWFYDFVSGAWVERGNARQSDPQSNDYFGLDLAISGDRMIVGAPNTFASTGQQGKAYIFEFNPTTRVWLQTQKLTATGGAAADFFGRGVAISGDVAVVGAQRADPGGVTDGGKAYVFRFNGTSWVQEQALVPSDVAASDFFGERVAVRDGTIVASSFGQDPGGISGAGAAYVFRHDGSQWVQDEKIVASNGVVSDQLGRGGMVLADDDKIYIGAQFADPGAVVNAGAVYTYAPLANSTLTGTLTITSAGALTQEATVSAGGAVNYNSGSNIAIDGALNAGANSVTLNAPGSVSQSAPITASSLALLGAGGSYALTNAANSISTLAANTGSLSFTNSGSFTVGTVGATSGISADGNVVLDAQGAGANVGVAADINKASGADATLTVRAAGDIVFSGGADITSTSGKLNVILNSNRDGLGTGGVALGSGTAITSNGGNVIIGGGTDPLNESAVGGNTYWSVLLDGATIDAAAGNISMRGAGSAGTGGFDRHGVVIRDGSSVTSAGNISITGQGGTDITANRHAGVVVLGSAITGTGSGIISISGTGGTGEGGGSRGVEIFSGSLIKSTGSGAIDITGVGGSGASASDGVLVDEASVVQSTSGGDIFMQGMGGSGAAGGNLGLAITGGAVVQSVGSGAIAIDGIGGSGSGSYNLGVEVSDGAQVIATTGAIDITGQAGGGINNMYGVSVKNPGTAIQTTTGNIILDGTGGTISGVDSIGVTVHDSAQVTSSGGNITLIGQGGSGTGEWSTGIQMWGNNTLLQTGGTGAITLIGTGGEVSEYSIGSVIYSGSVKTTGSGDITIIGQGGTVSAGQWVTGVEFWNGAQVLSTAPAGGGNISITGIAESGSQYGAVTMLSDGATVPRISSVSGDIAISGINSSTGANAYGVFVTTTSGNAVIESLGAANITIMGSAAGGTPGIFTESGLQLGGPSATGDIMLQSLAGDLSLAGSIRTTGAVDLDTAGLIHTPSGATLTLDGGTGGMTTTVNNGKTWQNEGTITLQGASSIRLPNVGGYATFSNAASGVLNVNSTAGWSFISDPSVQGGIVNNAGTINVNNSTAWEAAFTNASTGSLNIAASKFLSLQNGQSIAGTVDIGSGGTLWVSERHGANAAFDGTTINGTGTLQVVAGIGPVADFTNVNAGAATLLVGSGGTVNVLSGTSTFGALNMTGGTLSGAGNLLVSNNFSQTGGTQAGTGTTTLGPSVTSALGAVTVGRALTNQGTLSLNGPTLTGAVTNTGMLNVIGSTTASGGLTHQAGTLDISGGQTFTIGGSGFDWQGGTLTGAGSLVLPPGSSINITTTYDVAAPGPTLSASAMNVLAGGMLKGAGTVNANVNNSAGTVAPGASPGILTINGDYVQGPSGVLDMEIGGTTAGTQYDQLVVTGNVSLDGTLNTTLINSFVPPTGSSFNLIQSSGTVSGTFATTNVSPAGSPLTVSYALSEVTLAGSNPVVNLPVSQAVISPQIPATEEILSSLEEPDQVTQELQQATIAVADPEKEAETPPLCR